MIKKYNCILSSTHVDRQGDKMMKSALDSMLPQLNGKRKPRIGLNHIRTFPPFGAITNGEVFLGQDGEYYLSAEMLYFDQQDIIKLDDGTELLKESFSEGEYPFIECEENEAPQLSVKTDPANYETGKDLKEIIDTAKQESGLDFKTEIFRRKALLPDPETTITITTILAVTLGLVKSKVAEKVGEAVGEDLAKFYKFVSKMAVETIKKAKPANRPKSFVIEYPNSECDIELVITTHKHDDVVTSLALEKLSSVAEKVEKLKNLDPEKIQFVYSDNKEWEFNYLLSKTGAVIGTIKSFNKRNELYNKILKKQNEEESGQK